MDVQLFATTHSLEAVDALLQSIEAMENLNGQNNSSKDFVLYRLEGENGKNLARRFNSEKLHILREELGQEIRW